MWFDTTDSTLNVYYDDGSTQQWVTTSGPAGPQGVQGIQGPESASASATSLQATNNISTNASFYPVFVASVDSIQTVNAADTKLYFNPSTGTLNATNFNSLSDATYKENIEKIPNSIEMLNAIQTYSFNWKDNKNKSYGVIAQEFEKVMPELVEENANGDKTVSYMPLIAIIIEAIKKLDKKIEGKI
jgi:ASC-1-like (ASCH) protein